MLEMSGSQGGLMKEGKLKIVAGYCDLGRGSVAVLA
jgi:hypothetical protein